jgi:hypothetical protein
LRPLAEAEVLRQWQLVERLAIALERDGNLSGPGLYRVLTSNE